MTPDNKESVIAALSASFLAFDKAIDALNENQFTSSPEGKWTAGQHLDHLIRSVKPVNLAFSLPKWLLALLFGKRNRPTRNYEEVVAKYKAVLANGAVATGAYIPKPVPFGSKTKLQKAYAAQLTRLTKHLQRITDEQLDNLILPHPLLGKMTLREILFFTIYHTQHHLQNLSKIAADTQNS